MAPISAAGWYADPAGRSVYRYWDGAGWTAWVSEDGHAAVDQTWVGGGPGPGGRCPRCRAPLAGGARCAQCGLVLHGADIDQLRRLSDELDDVRRQLAALADEQRRLNLERDRVLARLAPAPPAPAGIHRPPPARPPVWTEWRPERVRDVLLWLGALLLAIAAVTFAVVAWSRLGQSGRAGMLAGATLVAAAGAAWAHRRLPATAEALAALTFALVLVDWFALRRAGVATGHAAPVWWAWGTALDAALATVAGRWFRALRVGAALAIVASGVLAVVAVTAAPWALAVGLAALAGAGAIAAALMSRIPTWEPSAIVLGVLGGAVDLAAVGALPSAAPIHAVGDAFGPAGALALAAVTPVVFRSLMPGVARRAGDLLVGAAAAALLGSVVVLLAGPFSGARLAAAAALVFAGGVVLSGLLPSALRRGLAVAGGLGTGGAAVGLIGAAAVAMFGPWAWAGKAWTVTGDLKALTHLGPNATTLHDGNPAAIAIAAALLATAALGVRLRHPPQLSRDQALVIAALGLLAEAALLPVLAGMTIAGVVAVQIASAAVVLATAVYFDRQNRLEAIGLAVLAAATLVPAGGWALASRGTTLAALGVTAVVTALSTVFVRRFEFRAALGGVAAAAALTEVGAATVAAGASAGAAALAVAIAGAAVLAAGAWGRRGAPEGLTLEAVALAALATAPLVAWGQPAWRAGSLTVAVPALAMAGLRNDRRPYLWADSAVAVLTTWAWLAAAHVTVIEAYTLPAAAVALCAGALSRKRDRRLESWWAYGPGLVAGFGPSLAVVLARGGLARPLLLTAAALVTVAAGSTSRLRAPVTIGAVTLVVLAIDTLGPPVARLPRWASIGAAGLVLLWLGATAERRLTQLRHLRDRYQAFD